MRYARVYVDAIGYELPPVVVSSAELEVRLEPAYRALRMPAGQVESLTGIVERRWWDAGLAHALSDGAISAGQHALGESGVSPEDLDVLIYAGVCREQFEPATACRVAAALGVGPATAIYDVSNACLGLLNGMLDVANRIELGQARAGLVVSCESAREIVGLTIDEMLRTPTMELFRESLATLTGGSGAAAVLLTDGSFPAANRHRLLGAVTRAAPQFHGLCRWGIEPADSDSFRQFMATDSIGVLKHGVELGQRTWSAFLAEMGWTADRVDRVICHQVGSGHRDTILRSIGLGSDKDFSTFPYLGNIGTVSVPITAALASEREFLRPGDRVGFLGIGSGLNCLMMGLEW